MDEIDDFGTIKFECATHGYDLSNTCLGSGGYGIVMLAYATPTNARKFCLNRDRKVAIKIINKEAEKFKDRKLRVMIKREINCLKSVRGSDNVVQFFETFEEGGNLYIVMEFAAHGDLVKFTREDRHNGIEMAEENARVIFKQLAEGLFHCHRSNVVHKDIKPQNILVGDGNKFKLCDFGMAQLVKSSGKTLIEYGGSRRYMSPEMVINKEAYDGKSHDIWGLGSVLYYLLFGRHPGPSKGIEVTKQSLLDAAKMATVAHLERPLLSLECIDILTKTLSYDWRNRISIEEIVNHSWLQRDGEIVVNNKKRKRSPEDIDEMAPELKFFKHEYKMATPPPVVLLNEQYHYSNISSNNCRGIKRLAEAEETVPVVKKLIISIGDSTTFSSEYTDYVLLDEYEYSNISSNNCRGMKRSAEAEGTVPAVKKVIISIGDTTTSFSSEYTEY